MSRPDSVSVVVEGASDAPIIVRLLRDHGIAVEAVLGLKGKGHVDTRLNGYNEAAKYGAWLVLRDLDRDAPCAATLVRSLLAKPNKGMCFRIAVPTVESWLLADAQGITKYFRVKPHVVPVDPEALPNAKSSLVEVASRSALRAIREDMVPVPGTTATVGPGYVARVTEFAAEEWNWRRASTRSESLRRCLLRIAKWR